MFSLLLYPCLLCYLSSAAPLLLIMFEGFRWDYLDIYERELESLGRFAKAGVRAEYLEPDFPTTSFINEYTIMTGLYNEYHGISYGMLDPLTGEAFWEGDAPLNYFLDKTEPIWIAAERQGKRSYFFDWPFCHVELNGRKATYCDHSFSDGIIANQLKTGFDVLLNSTADFVGIYTTAVDFNGHQFGPRSFQVRELMATLINNEISAMMSDLEKLDLRNELNVLIVSGHGMTQIYPDRVITLTDYIDFDDIDQYTGDVYGKTFVELWPLPGTFDQVYNSLRSAHVNMTVYKKEDSPEHWHYHNHRRIAPILVTVEEGWVLLINSEDSFPYYEEHANENITHPFSGNHGYDNLFSDMRGIFLASGPAFKSSYTSGPIKAVDVYQVICTLLDITPSPHNGSWERVGDMFKSSSSSPATSPTICFSLILMAVFITFLNRLPRTS